MTMIQTNPLDPTGRPTDSQSPELRDSEAKYRSLFEGAKDSIFTLLDGRISECNDRTLELFGGHRHQVIGRSPADMSPPDQPDGTGSHEKAAAMIGAALAGKPQFFEWQLQRLDNGNLVDAEVTLNRIDAGGQMFLQAIIRDITDRKRAEQSLRESEERFARLAEAAFEGVALTDQGIILDVNEQLARMLGFPRSTLIGRAALDFVALESREKVLEHLRSGDETPYRHLARRGDGSTFPVEIRAKQTPYKGRSVRVTAIIDITDRKRAEEELQIFKFATDQAADAVFWMKQDGSFYYVNEQACHSLGYTREELMRLRLFDIDPVYPKERWDDAWRRFHRGETQSEHIETLHRRKDGTVFPVEISSKHFWFGRTDLHVAFVRDITARKEAEKALGERETMLHSLFRSAPVGIGVGMDRVIKEVNDRLCEMTGFTRVELIGSSTRVFYASEEEFLRAGRELYGYGTLRTGDYHLKRKDGALLEVQISTSPLDLKDLSKGVTFTVVDLTERKKIEERNRQQAALLEASHDAVLVWELKGGIRFMNRAAEALTGWSYAAVQSKSLEEILRPRSELSVRAALKDATARGEWRGSLTLLTSDGKEQEVDSRWALVGDAHGKPKSILITCNDITEKRRLEKQYLRAQRLESVGTLASGVAHDLNNILSPVLMGLDMLEDVIKDPENQGILKMMQDSAQRGKDTVHQLLTFARGTESQKGPVQPRHVLKEISRLVEQTFPKNIQIYTDFAQRPATVLADPSQLHQVLMNLCVNARDAMPEGGVLSVTLENRGLDRSAASIHPKARPGPYVVFKVADSGAGIRPEILDRIFDPFFTTKPQGKGTGLGLATVLGIVEGHGGFVQVDSTVGQGTTFSIYLPACVTEETGRSAAEGHAAPQGHGELVLVVDDEPAILKLAESVLRRNGYEALTATHASEALNLYERNHERIRVVLTDIMMPFGDGRQLITLLFDQNPRLNILAMSGLATTDFRRETLTRGAKAFLSKPFKAEQLLVLLSEILKTT